MRELNDINLLFGKSGMSTVGRTLIFNVLYLLSMAATAFGGGLIILGILDMRILVYIFYPLVGFGQLFFLCATLSVSSVWNKMAKKVTQRFLKDENSALAATESASANTATASFFFRAKVGCIRRLMTISKLNIGADAPISVSLSALTVAMMISYFSPLYISAALSVCCLVVALSFAAAGSRMAYLMALSVEPISLKRQRHPSLNYKKKKVVESRMMLTKVQRTFRTGSSLSMAWMWLQTVIE